MKTIKIVRFIKSLNENILENLTFNKSEVLKPEGEELPFSCKKIK